MSLTSPVRLSRIRKFEKTYLEFSKTADGLNFGATIGIGILFLHLKFESILFGFFISISGNKPSLNVNLKSRGSFAQLIVYD